MALLAWWLSAAVILLVLQARSPKRVRGVRAILVVLGLAGVYGMTRISWTVQLHAAMTCAIVGTQVLAACWVCRLSAVGSSRRVGSVEAFCWLMAFLAVTQVRLVHSMGGDALPLVLGLCVVALAGGRAVRESLPLLALGAVTVAWGVEALWTETVLPAALYIPTKSGVWLDAPELLCPSLSLPALALAGAVALAIRVIVARPWSAGRRVARGVAATWILAVGGPALTLLVAWTLHHAMGGGSLATGAVLSTSDLAARLPAEFRAGGLVRAPSIPAMKAARGAVSQPAWLYFSNNPECVPEDSLARCRVLARNTVPAGEGRLLISHFSPDARPQSLVVEYENRGAEPATVRVTRFEVAGGTDAVGRMVESGVGLWEQYAHAEAIPTVRHLAPGERWRQRFDARSGAIMAMGDVKCDRSLVITTALVGRSSLENEVALDDVPVLPLKGPQTRGVFLHPDESIQAHFNLDEGRPRRLTLARVPLLGCDGDPAPPLGPAPATGSSPAPRPVQQGFSCARSGVPPGQPSSRVAKLQGRYGGFSRVHLKVERSPGGAYRRLLLLLVPTGGWCGALLHGRPRAIDPHCGLVVCNERVERALELDYDFTLPANSSGPVHLIVIPCAE